MSSRTSVPPPGPGPTAQVGADQQRPLAHAADAGALRRAAQAPAVVARRAAPRRPRCVPALSRRPGWRGVAGGVGEALLGHPVEHQFGLRVQRRQVGAELRGVRPAAAAGNSVPSARSALISPSSSSTPGRSRRAMRRISSRLLRVVSCTCVQLVAHRRRRVVGDPLEVEQHGGQRLADLVVQLLGDAAPLALLRGQRAGAAGGPLGLQPVEHGVEGGDQLGDRRVSGHGRTRARAAAGRSWPSRGSAAPAGPARSAAGPRWRPASPPARR